jgi:dCMP deaminase
MTRPSWDQHFLDMAALAATRSKDRSTRVGAVIVDLNRNVRATGYNGFPRLVNDDIDARHERPIKYRFTEHAERNAIYSAARAGVSTDRCTMYCTHAPCTDCARAVIQAGIYCLFYPTTGVIPTFTEDTEIALAMLREANVSTIALARSETV